MSIENMRDYWEQKILKWEFSRYSDAMALHPLSWTVRRRLDQAVATILHRLPKNSSVFEIGCGTGRLMHKIRHHLESYCGIDIARNAIEVARSQAPRTGVEFYARDVMEGSLEAADLTVFLGVTDWLDEEQLPHLFKRIQSPNILFSYSETTTFNPYRLYRFVMDRSVLPHHLRARTYTAKQIQHLLLTAGFKGETIVTPSALNPGALVWAVKENA